MTNQAWLVGDLLITGQIAEGFLMVTSAIKSLYISLIKLKNNKNLKCGCKDQATNLISKHFEITI